MQKRFEKGGETPLHDLTAAGAGVPDGFLGRKSELAAIHHQLQAGKTALLVNAEGGMGKTTLAAKYWADYGGQYAHRAWVFCHSTILAEMQNKLAAPLGLQDIFDKEADADARLHHLKNAMAQLDGPCLLVLDNANNAEHIRGFLMYMSGLSNWRALLTSRCEKVLPERDSELKIQGLPPDLAKALFKKNHDEGTPEFEALLDRFLRAVDYNTLCIDIFSRNLNEADGWGDDMAAFLQKLEKQGLLLGPDDSFSISAHYAHTNGPAHIGPLRSSDEIVEALYNFAELDEAQTDLLIRFALLPAQAHPPEVLTPLLADGDPKALGKKLKALNQKGWLAAEAANAYRISPVVQKIVLQKHPDRRRQQTGPMLQILIKLFETEGYHSKNIAIAAPFADLVLGMADLWDATHEDLKLLYHGVWIYFTAAGNLTKALECAGQMRDLNEKMEDKNGLAISYEKLGETHTALGNLTQALTFFEDETILFKELHQARPQNVSFKNGLAVSYSKLGETHTALGNLTQALTFFEDETTLFEELHEAYPQNVSFKNGLAVSYSKLGETHTALGNLTQALTFFEERNRLGKELHEAFPQNVDFKNGLAISYGKLGETHTDLGNLPLALTFFENYNQLEKELHQAFPQNVDFKNGLVISYSKLGSTHTALGNLNQALTFFEQDLELSKELHQAFPQNVDFKNGLAISYGKLGETHTDLGNLPLALTFFENYNQLKKELHQAFPQNVDFKNGLAISYQFLGNTHTALGNLNQALTFFENYNQLKKELHEAFPQNVTFKNGLAISYAKLGETHTALGNLTQALAFFENYNQLEKELHQAYPQNVAFKNLLAVSYSQLGRFYRDQLKEPEKAKPYFQACYGIWEALSGQFSDYAEFKRNFEWAQNALSALG